MRNRTHYLITPPHALFQDNCHLDQTLNYTLKGYPTLSLGRPPPWQDPSWEHSLLLEATHRVTLCHRSSQIYLSLFSPAAPWLIQSDHVLMDDPKRSAVKSLEILPLTPVCDLFSQGLFGRVLSAQEFFLCDYELPFSFLPVRLTRFHQDLGWLSCLRSPTFTGLYGYLEPNGFSAPILLSLCTIDDLTPERLSRL